MDTKFYRTNATTCWTIGCNLGIILWTNLLDVFSVYPRFRDESTSAREYCYGVYPDVLVNWTKSSSDPGKVPLPEVTRGQQLSGIASCTGEAVPMAVYPLETCSEVVGGSMPLKRWGYPLGLRCSLLDGSLFFRSLYWCWNMLRYPIVYYAILGSGTPANHLWISKCYKVYLVVFQKGLNPVSS